MNPQNEIRSHPTPLKKYFIVGIICSLLLGLFLTFYPNSVFIKYVGYSGVLIVMLLILFAFYILGIINGKIHIAKLDGKEIMWFLGYKVQTPTIRIVHSSKSTMIYSINFNLSSKIYISTGNKFRDFTNFSIFHLYYFFCFGSIPFSSQKAAEDEDKDKERKDTRAPGLNRQEGEDERALH